MRIHIVQKGDTLYEIAKQYGVDFEKLVSLNSHLSSPDMIMPGMKIKIPSESKQVRSTTDKGTRISAVRDEPKMEKERRVEPVEERREEKERKVEPIQRDVVEKEKKEEVQIKPKEMPIQKDDRDELLRPKRIAVPKQPRPIMEQPTMPKKMKLEELEKDTKESRDIHPERKILYKKELKEPVSEDMQYYQPVQQQMMYSCCCCSCCRCRPRPVACHCSSRNYPRPNYHPYPPNPYYGNPYNPMY